MKDEDLRAEVELADAIGDLAAGAAVFVATINDDHLSRCDFLGIVGLEGLHVFGGVEVPKDGFGQAVFLPCGA